MHITIENFKLSTLFIFFLGDHYLDIEISFGCCIITKDCCSDAKAPTCAVDIVYCGVKELSIFV